MSEHPILDPIQAKASLDEVGESRRAAVRAGSRPLGVDLAMAAVVGSGVGLGLGGHGIVALGVLLVGSAGVTLVQRRLTRRHGQALDLRALRARMWGFALLYLVLLLLTMVEPSATWRPWFAAGVGVAAGVGSFIWLRWNEHYRNRRLADGTYDRYDLL